jgi:hypothetical protein
VQELTLETELARAAVHGIARDRKVDCGEVDADLMRATGLESHREQGMPRQQLGNLEVRDRLARGIGVERVSERIATVATDRRFDSSAA